jgi:hypothetical protein
MDPMMEPIAGVSLQKYAELIAAMSRTEDDKAAQLAIAVDHGLDEPSWIAARDGWTARMEDPANEGRVAHAFVPLYTAAQGVVRVGHEPATLERYATVVAEYSFEKDPDGKQIPVDTVLARHGYDRARWSEVTGYWTPKVNDPSDAACARFRELMQSESDRIFGIDRGASGELTQEPEDSGIEVVQPAPAPEKGDDGVVGMVMGWVRSVLG